MQTCNEICSLREMLIECRKREPEFRRLAAIRLSSQSSCPDSIVDEFMSSSLSAKLILGRRYQYDQNSKETRTRVYKESDNQIEIVSYDRVIDVLNRLRTDTDGLSGLHDS